MRIRELEVVQALRRARFNIANDDEEGLRKLLEQVNRQLEQVEASYR